MKRHHHHHHHHQQSSSAGGGDGTVSGGKAKIWQEEEDGHGMDELLSVLGYKVKSTDMADVALKLEQLEMAMGTAQLGDAAGIPSLSSSDTIHYNPSDLSNWVQSMLSELNPVPSESDNQDQEQHHHPQLRNQPSIVYEEEDRYDLSAIPGDAVYGKNDQQVKTSNCSKRMRTSIGSEFCESSSHQASRSSTNRSEIKATVGGESEASMPLVMVVEDNDSQETGVRLVHALLACAEAVQQDNLKVADALIKHIGVLAAAQDGAMRKVATYFAEALARRIYRMFPHEAPTCSSSSSSYDDMLEMHFYDTCPYLKFAHFTANQAILETLSGGADKVHVIDFGLKQGMQWPALMQALALRPGGPPVFRLTGVVPPPPQKQSGSNAGDGGDAMEQVGWKLAQVANALGVKFEFKEAVAKSLADLEPSKLEIGPPEAETLVVNAVFELHRLLASPESVEKVLAAVKAMRPKIVTVVEQEANHNGPVFLDRFTEALHYYSTLFDSLEGSGSGSGQDLVMSEMYLGRQICNVVACEGAERVERHEPLTRWRTRMESAGFDPVHLGSNAFKQASMLLALFSGGDGYRVEEREGCLTLGWHTRPLIATSAWQLAAVRN